MDYTKYFKSFDYKNKSKQGKSFPFITNYINYTDLVEYKYTIKDLKDIIKRMKLPKCKYKKKNEIHSFCTNILFLSFKIQKIQKVWRNYFISQFNKTLGPSYGKYHLSNNNDDFLTTEDIKDIDYYYYFSFKDKDHFIYTFHIVSIYSLLSKNLKKNPYNRNDFDNSLIDCIQKRIRYNRILKKTNDFQEYQTRPTSFQDRVVQIFHHMDQLGQYTSISWFNHLNSNQHRVFIYELYEIWNYRAQLTQEVKEIICPPRGNPFSILPRNFINNYNNPHVYYSNHFLKNCSICIMEKLAYSAHNNENKKLGILYILSGLTLVSENARNSLPWLYASVYHN